MATRRKSGLGVGQVLTLTFGFLLASVIIFVFGVWVGRDVSRQREREDRPVVVVEAEPIGASPTETVGFVDDPIDRPDVRPTRPRFIPTATASARPPATRTSTRPPRKSKPTAQPKPTGTAVVSKPTPAPKAMWTVQAAATNDQVQALVSARQLRTQGYEASTMQEEVGGTTWYRVQVGKFKDKREAQKVADRLRAKGMEAAFVERLR